MSKKEVNGKCPFCGGDAHWSGENSVYCYEEERYWQYYEVLGWD